MDPWQYSRNNYKYESETLLKYIQKLNKQCNSCFNGKLYIWFQINQIRCTLCKYEDRAHEYISVCPCDSCLSDRIDKKQYSPEKEKQIKINHFNALNASERMEYITHVNWTNNEKKLFMGFDDWH